MESILHLPAEKLAGVIFVYMDPSTLSDTQGKRIHVEHEYGSALCFVSIKIPLILTNRGRASSYSSPKQCVLAPPSWSLALAAQTLSVYVSTIFLFIVTFQLYLLHDNVKGTHSQ